MLRTSAQVSGHPWTGHGGATGLLSQAASQEPAAWLTTARQPLTRVSAGQELFIDGGRYWV